MSIDPEELWSDQPEVALLEHSRGRLRSGRTVSAFTSKDGSVLASFRRGFVHLERLTGPVAAPVLISPAELLALGELFHLCRGRRDTWASVHLHFSGVGPARWYVQRAGDQAAAHVGHDGQGPPPGLGEEGRVAVVAAQPTPGWTQTARLVRLGSRYLPEGSEVGASFSRGSLRVDARRRDLTLRRGREGLVFDAREEQFLRRLGVITSSARPGRDCSGGRGRASRR
jgi:hypothetical protein